MTGRLLFVAAVAAAAFAGCAESIPEFSVVRAIDVTISHGPVPLSGTLLLPGEGGVYPAVIFVQGRSYGSSEQFRHHARQFAAKGVAGLVFDGRGHGNSGGDPETVTAEDRYADALAAVEFAARYPEIDSERIGLFGHSAGGWIVPVVADRDPRVKALILHAGPAVSLDVQQGQVVASKMRADESESFTDKEIAAAQAFQERLVNYAMRGVTFDAIERFVASAENERWKSRVDRPAREDDAELSFFRRQPYDSRAALERLRVPILALYGGDDLVVNAEANAQALRQAARAAGNDQVEIRVFEGADHSLQVSDGVLPDEYWPTLLGWAMRTFESEPAKRYPR